MRAYGDGHQEEWWALEVEAGPYGPARWEWKGQTQRYVVELLRPRSARHWGSVSCPRPLILLSSRHGPKNAI
jgi:hypothetical protein